MNDSHYTGVYAIAYSDRDISGWPFEVREEIVYFGMTNDRGGLRSRLKQFDDTVAGGSGHGGGQRVILKHRQYSRLAGRLYVAVCPCKCGVTSNRPADLRIMGEVAMLEYEYLALFVEKIGRLPEFNY